jgi:hypothetical protein
VTVRSLISASTTLSANLGSNHETLRKHAGVTFNPKNEGRDHEEVDGIRSPFIAARGSRLFA